MASGNDYGGPTADHIARAEEAMRLGHTHTRAAAYVGVHRATYYRWRDDGEANPDSPAGEFVRALQRGAGDNATECLTTLLTAVREGNTGAAQWLLERRHGYRREDRSEHDVTVRQAPVDREALAEWVAAKLDATDEE